MALGMRHRWSKRHTRWQSLWCLRGIPVFHPQGIATTSHQFAIEATRYGGGQTAAKRLRAANLLACGIGLPIAAVAGDLNGLRFGTPEIVRRGMRPGDMPTLAEAHCQSPAREQS